MASQPWAEEPEEQQRASARTSKAAAPPLSGKNLAQAARQIWLAGLGAMAATSDEGTHLFRMLVERGKEVEPSLSEGWSRVREEWSDKVQRIGQQVRGRSEEGAPERENFIRQMMERMDLPSRKDLDDLAHRVDELSRQVTRMAGESHPKAQARTTATKTTASRTRRRTSKG